MSRFLVSSRGDTLEQFFVDAEDAEHAGRLVKMGYGGAPVVSEIRDREILDVTTLPPLTPKEQSE